MSTALITSPAGVMAVLVGVVSFWFWLEKKTRWGVFNFLPPLIFIYASPVLLSNGGIIPFKSEAYDFLRQYGLPVFIVLMLIKVDVLSAVRIMGKGVLVMLIGSVGVVLGGVLAYTLGQSISLGGFLPLSVDSWKAFGTLAGSWIGGTGNMTAAHAALDGSATDLTMAAAADQMVYLVWLPLLLGCKAFADRFNRWARVPEGRLAQMEKAAAELATDEKAPSMIQLLYLALLALGFTWIAIELSDVLPPVVVGGATVITASTWLILLVTTMALITSVTPARNLPAAQTIAMAIIYVYVARVGATMDLSSIDWQQTAGFVAMAYVWIAIHGVFVLAGAWIFRVDVHTLAIASAANIGGAASAPIVAAHHRESLVPASILMALIGYALGNYLAILTGRLGQLIGG
ncbi:MAG: DUF819 family protein [Xanthomonadales bacterium]|nr:DUF819 family protein [Gammaproteobacteria bacterium]NNE04249.1 DUF819 family protein [Xanthomonadales bacterium]NNL94851.1 DUF819 family protein [Xanthomonadales bacterium]